MTTFDVRVELALTSGYTTPAASRVWTDVTNYVTPSPVDVKRGRQDEHSQVTPSTCSLALDNIDGRFTPENAAGAHYPNVKKGRPIRVRVRYPASQAGNFATPDQASVETSAADWATNTAFGGYDPAGSVAQSAVRAFNGTKSVLATWSTTALGNWVGTNVTGLVVGRTYTASLYVYVPAGSPDPRLDVLFNGFSTRTTTKGAWTRLSTTFVGPSGGNAFVGVQVASATAGQTCFVDALMVDEGTTVAPFTTAAPPFVDRFTGYVNDWGVEWPDGGDAFAVAKVSASSRAVRLASRAPLRSIIEEEIGLDDPVLYYPLGDAEGALVAGNSATTRQDPLTVTQGGTGGTLQFGTGTGPGTDGLSAPILTRASANDGVYLRMAPQAQLTDGFDSVLALEVFFNTSTTAAQTLTAVYADNTRYIHLGVNATGKLEAEVLQVTNDGVTVSSVVTSAATVSDGGTHHGAVRVTLNDATGQATVSLHTDGVAVTGAPISWCTFAGVTFFPAYIRYVVGGPAQLGQVGSMFNGTLAHAAVYVQEATGVLTDARIAAHGTAGSTGFAGESSDVRVTRYAGYARIPAAEVSAELGLSTSIAHVDTSGALPLDLMQKVATTEDGLLFDGRDGRLTFHARSHRYNVASALSLDFAAQEVAADFAPQLDDRGMVNDFTASRAGGISVRSVDNASIDEYGYYRDSIELVTTSDAEVQSAADWRVSRYSTPRMKIPALGVDLMTVTTSKVATLLAADFGTRFTLANAPTQFGSATQDLFVEGLNESISINGWDMTLNVSPVVLSSVWQLDSSTYSVLDTSTLLAY